MAVAQHHSSLITAVPFYSHCHAEPKQQDLSSPIIRHNSQTTSHILNNSAAAASPHLLCRDSFEHSSIPVCLKPS
ncbi:hypothetical protein M0R45_009014 [Rubus argutus]|uniref:Uncharacterized protein n=1 Tax=Rubus argutus TaxID=59490 RepID=A0AAW1Y3A5_RUBAR